MRMPNGLDQKKYFNVNAGVDGAVVSLERQPKLAYLKQETRYIDNLTPGSAGLIKTYFVI